MGVAVLALLASVAYLIGSIPAGYLVARWKGIADIRSVGSGNIGATNVGRHIGLPYFFIVLLLDSAKAYFCLYWIGTFGVSLPVLYLCAGALLIGNGHSLFLNFTGGKGVATGIGIIAYMSPPFLFVLIGSWAVILWCCKDVGVTSVFSYWILCLGTVMTSYEYPLFLMMLAFWITLRHRENLKWYFNIKRAL